MAARTEMKGGFADGRVIRIRFLLLAGVMGTSAATAQTWRITPSLTAAETLTDNVALAPDNLKQSDLITQVTPGISITGDGARLKLNLNYQMNNILYAHQSSQNTIQNFLSSTANLEAVKNWLFIDANASITQQAISAFGSQPNGTANINNNRAEARTYGLSPYIRGRLSPTTDYLVRYRYTATSVKGNSANDAAIEEWTGTVSGVVTPIPKLGWRAEGTNQTSHYNVGSDFDTSRLRGVLTYEYDPQLRFSASGGYEKDNYPGVNQPGQAIYGGGFDWSPTVRTQVSAFVEKRPFGNFHNISAQHRTPRTAWRYSDTQDVTTLPNQLVTVPLGTAFDLLFNALTSQIPDPVLRAQEVQRQLQQNGTPANLILPGQFLTTRVFQNHSRTASLTILGIRNTVTFAASWINSSAVGANPAGVADDFSSSSEIEQKGITADWAHRWSPLTSLNVLASQYTSTAKATNLESKQSSFRVGLTRQIGPKASGSLGVRYVRFDGGNGGLSDYREKAVTASVNVTF